MARRRRRQREEIRFHEQTLTPTGLVLLRPLADGSEKGYVVQTIYGVYDVQTARMLANTFRPGMGLGRQRHATRSWMRITPERLHEVDITPDSVFGRTLIHLRTKLTTILIEEPDVEIYVVY